MSYKNVIESLSEGLTRIHLDGPRDATNPDSSFIAAELISRQEQMPDFMRLPIRLLTVCFNLSGLLHGGQLFRHMPDDARTQRILAWKHSRVGLCRNLIRFYESLFLLIALQEQES